MTYFTKNNKIDRFSLSLSLITRWSGRWYDRFLSPRRGASCHPFFPHFFTLHPHRQSHRRTPSSSRDNGRSLTTILHLSAPIRLLYLYFCCKHPAWGWCIPKKTLRNLKSFFAFLLPFFQNWWTPVRSSINDFIRFFSFSIWIFF